MMGFLDQLQQAYVTPQINRAFANSGRGHNDMLARYGGQMPPNPTPPPSQGFLSGLMGTSTAQPGQAPSEARVSQPRAPGGFLGGLHNSIADNRNMLMAAGTGLLSDGWAGAGNAMYGAQMDQQRRDQQSQQEAEERQRAAQMQLGEQYGIDPLVFDAGMGEQALGQAMRPAEREPTGRARQLMEAGYQYGSPEFQQAMRDDIFGDNTNLPPGYRMSDGGAEPIPGTPQHQEWMEAQRQQEEQQGARSTAGDVVFNAASRALEASRSRSADGVAGIVAGVNPVTDSAEVYRQTRALQDIASAEALNAMRRQSPTGGALGNVTERELALLSRQAGALDPASPNYERDLRDYTLAVYQTIHGYEAGTQRFEVEMAPSFANSSASQQDPLARARDAISRGADPQAVRQRLLDNGIDPAGLQ